MPTTIHVQLEIRDLGNIPEYHQDDPRVGQKAVAYFDDGICDAPLSKQLAHFGRQNVAHMLRGELTSWLDDLGVAPRITSITITN